MSDLTTSNNSYYGVSIVMSQREPYVNRKHNKSFQYDVFGYFDEMRIDVVENLNDFAHFQEERLLGRGGFESIDERTEFRMKYHPETKKILLCGVDNDGEKNLLKEYAERGTITSGDSNVKPFIGLIAVKLVNQCFYGNVTSCNNTAVQCIKNYIGDFKSEQQKHGKHKMHDFDDFVLWSLSVDDVYVLIGANNPNTILRLTRFLQYQGCGKNSCCSAFKNSSKERWLENIEYAEERQFKGLDLGEIKNKDFGKDRESLRECLHDMWEEEQKKEDGGSIALLYWLIDCMNCLRTDSPIPVVLHTHTILGYRRKFDKHCEKLCELDKCIYLSNENVQKIFKDYEKEKICLCDIRDLKEFDSKALRDFLREKQVEYSGKLDYLALSTVLDADFKNLCNEKRLTFNLRLRLPPGADLDAPNELLSNENMSYDCKRAIRSSLGQYGYTKRVDNYPVSKMLDLFNEKPFSWSDECKPEDYPLDHIIQTSYVQLYCDADNTEDIETDERKQMGEIRQQMLNEDISIANAWASQQHKFGTELFEKLNKIEEYKEKFPFLEKLLSEISLLHIQACRRFYYSFIWSAFSDVRKFFEKFYEKLRDVFDELANAMKKPENEDDATDIAIMLYYGMKLFCERISTLLNDRLVLEAAISENTRAGVYATGAYEALIEYYSNWIEDLSASLKHIDYEVKPGSREVEHHYVFVPAEHNRVCSHHPFTKSTKGKTVVIYEMSFKDMLEFRNALPHFVHELGHYIAITNRKKRVETYLLMVSVYFAQSLQNALCNLNRTHSKPLIKMTDDVSRKLAEDVHGYLKSRCKKLREENEQDTATKNTGYYLNHIEIKCKQWFNEFIKHFLDNSIIENIEPEMSALQTSLWQLYVSTHSQKHIHEGSKNFEDLLPTLLEDSLSVCKEILKECYADLLMIHVLNLDISKYLRILLNSLKVRNEDIESFTGVKSNMPSITSKAIPIDFVRVICAILHSPIKDSDTAPIKAEEITKLTSDKGFDEDFSEKFEQGVLDLGWKTVKNINRSDNLKERYNIAVAALKTSDDKTESIELNLKKGVETYFFRLNDSDNLSRFASALLIAYQCYFDQARQCVSEQLSGDYIESLRKQYDEIEERLSGLAQVGMLFTINSEKRRGKTRGRY